ncbi:MAG: MGMT family protein, partial [Spirochaetaceae bacterium]|nr:MGMT family protein [Spirochaetaceae bacterium]
ELVRIILAPDDIEALQCNPHPVAFSGSEASLPGEIRPFVDFVHQILNGYSFIFPLDQIPLWRCGGFQQRVLAREHGIPPGKVSTYARLAQACGTPKAVRAVGSALSHNPFPLLIPCHRTIRTDGGLGGYQGGLDMKRWLLANEGVSPGPNGKISLDDICFDV